jgi:hypothetical protein
MHVDLAAAHWLYLAGVIVVLVTMGLRRNPIIPAVLFTGLVAWVFTGDLVNGIVAVFNGTLTAATDLFSIVLIIALITAMLSVLRTLGSDTLMVRPFGRLMKNGHLAFIVLAALTYGLALFFWPTPTVPLIAAVLIPAAIRAGLTPMGVGLAIGIAGQGMALSSDYVIRVAPSISAKASGADAGAIADRTLVLSIIVGTIALALAYLMERRRITTRSEAAYATWEAGQRGMNEPRLGMSITGPLDRVATAATGRRAKAGERVVSEPVPAGVAMGVPTGGDDAGTPTSAAGGGSTGDEDAPPVGRRLAQPHARTMAIGVPVAYALLVVYMIASKLSDGIPDLQGSEAAAMVGGIALLLCFAAAVLTRGHEPLGLAAESIIGGFGFAMKVMAIVFPIAGFFFLGNPEYSGQIMGLEEGANAPGFLFDLVNAGQAHLPENGLVLGFGLLLAGMVGGLDGAGFSVLPLTGAIAGSFGDVSSVDTATLASIGQMGAIWVGGGTLAAWSSIIVVAGFAGVSAVELARRCFIPVVSGLVVATLVAVLFM